MKKILSVISMLILSSNVSGICADTVKKAKCTDFSSQAEAQAAFKKGGPEISAFNLDRDKDGVACEGLLEGTKKSKKVAEE